MTLVSLAGTSATGLRLTLPAWGLWWADVTTEDDAGLSVGDTASLDVTGTACACAVVAAGVVEGRGAYRLVGGVGGWGQTVVRRGYQDDLGVRVSTVLSDVASTVGETLADVPTTRLGTRFARPAGPASAVLALVADRAWYVGLDGVTRFGARAASTYTGDAPRTRLDPAGSIVELATESIDELVPGVSVDGSEPATDVEFSLDGDRFTVRVYSGTRTSRRPDALQQLLNALDPRRKFRGAFEYRVVTQEGDRLNLQPVRVASGMPDLSRVEVRLSAGIKAQHTLGSTVMVSFADADPSRPFVFTGDAAGAPGWSPTTLDLQGTSDAIALASDVDARLTDLHDAISGAAVLGGDGGATFKTNIIAALTAATAPDPWPTSTASSKVRAV